MSIRRHSGRRRRGASAVEFAIIAPVLMLITFSGLDWAWYFVAYQELQLSVRAAAHVGAQTHPDDGQIETALIALEERFHQGAALPGLDADGQASIIDNRLIQVEAIAYFKPLVGAVPVPHEIRSAYCALLEVEPPPP